MSRYSEVSLEERFPNADTRRHNSRPPATKVGGEAARRNPGVLLNVPNARAGVVIAAMTLWFLMPLLHASGLDITVRLINARSGKPLREVPVTMFSWNGPATYSPDNIPKSELAAHTATDAEGRAVFHSAQPIPQHIGFSVGTPLDFAGCWRLQDSSPETVLHSGVVAAYNEARCGRLKQQVSAKPGEVVIFEKKPTLWEKMRQEIP